MPPLMHSTSTAASLVLDRPSLTYLWAQSPGHSDTANPAYTPPLAARRRLCAQGLIAPTGELSERGWNLMEPLISPRRIIKLTRFHHTASHRRIWVNDTAATAVDPGTAHTKVFTALSLPELTRSAAMWLGVRPLPAPAMRPLRPCWPLPLSGVLEGLALNQNTAPNDALGALGPKCRNAIRALLEGDATVWVASEIVDGTVTRVMIALDDGRNGWWMNRTTPSPKHGARIMQPTDSAAIYVALARFLRACEPTLAVESTMTANHAF